MYTRSLTKNIKSYGKSRATPSSNFRRGQAVRNVNYARNRVSAPVLGRIRYTPTIRREVKCLDTTFQAAYNAVWTIDTFPQRVLNTNYTPSFQSLALIQQGPGLSQRIGNKVSLKSLRLRFCIVNTVLTNISPVPPDVRVMVVYDRQPNGTYPAANDLLNSLNQANALTNPTLDDLVTTNLNPNNFERFTVIMDKSFTLPSFESTQDTVTNNGPTGDGMKSPWWIDEYIKLKGLECCYKGTTNPEVVGDVTTGNLFIMCVGENAPISTPWAFKGTARLRFHDN